MTRNMSIVLYTVVMIAVVVGVDLLFFKNRFWERLTVNIGIVLVFATFYFMDESNKHRINGGVAETVEKRAWEQSIAQETLEHTG